MSHKMLIFKAEIIFSSPAAIFFTCWKCVDQQESRSPHTQQMTTTIMKSSIPSHGIYVSKQCSGSMTYWSGSGSGSADPCLCYFRHWPSRKLIFISFLLITFWRNFFIIFQKIKSPKKSQNSKNQGFSYYFCLLIEGSESKFIPLTNGSRSGSGRPQNMWIRWIRIWNTVSKNQFQNAIDFSQGIDSMASMPGVLNS